MLPIINEDLSINIEPLIELAREEYPDEPEIITALQNATGGHWRRKAYYAFVDSTNANQPGAEWQFKDSFPLEHSLDGTIVLDLLMDGRIGGIEFISLIED